MSSKTVYQYDVAGRYLGETLADESPLEAGVYHLPARTTEQGPPPKDSWPEGRWPRWNGISWLMIGSTDPLQQPPEDDPLEKLARFLEANPDVLAVMDRKVTS
jgi:hypothetical protein